MLSLEKLTKIDVRLSIFKFLVYYLLLFLSVYAIISLKEWYFILCFQVVLGYIFAYGLELQHECLHANMFKEKWLNQFTGFLLGVPLLVSFTHYKVQHLHHHKYLGSDHDKEIFDYDSTSFDNFFKFFVRAWNLARIPTFIKTFFQLMRGQFPPVFQKEKDRKNLRQEYMVLFLLFSMAIIYTITTGSLLILKIWFIPWLLFGEFFHFIIEIPEHLGCNKKTKDVLKNTRTIKAGRLMSFITNYNNFHVEHHLYPKVAFHKLRQVNRNIGEKIENVEDSYLGFYNKMFKELFSGKREMTK